MTQILLIVLFSGLAVTLSISVFRINHWKSMWENQYSVYSETLDRALGAEREAANTAKEYEYLKNTINLIASRNSIAVMTDEQIRILSQTLSQLVISQTKPNMLN